PRRTPGAGREAPDGAARRQRLADPHHELRRGTAGGAGPRRKRVEPEPPRGDHLLIPAMNSVRITSATCLLALAATAQAQAPVTDRDGSSLAARVERLEQQLES